MRSKRILWKHNTKSETAEAGQDVALTDLFRAEVVERTNENEESSVNADNPGQIKEEVDC